MNLIDNVLRPIIFTRGLKTPMLVIIVGVIGGTLSNEIIGLFVGPIVLAVVWDLLVAFIRGKACVRATVVSAAGPRPALHTTNHLGSGPMLWIAVCPIVPLWPQALWT